MWSKYTHNPTTKDIREWGESVAGDYLEGGSQRKLAFQTLERLPVPMRAAVAAYATHNLSDPTFLRSYGVAVTRNWSMSFVYGLARRSQ